MNLLKNFSLIFVILSLGAICIYAFKVVDQSKKLDDKSQHLISWIEQRIADVESHKLIFLNPLPSGIDCVSDQNSIRPTGLSNLKQKKSKVPSLPISSDTVSMPPNIDTIQKDCRVVKFWSPDYFGAINNRVKDTRGKFSTDSFHLRIFTFILESAKYNKVLPEGVASKNKSFILIPTTDIPLVSWPPGNKQLKSIARINSKEIDVIAVLETNDSSKYLLLETNTNNDLKDSQNILTLESDKGIVKEWGFLTGDLTKGAYMLRN